MPISADAGVIPAFVSTSFTFSRASGGVTMYHAEPSSFRSSAPASSTRSSSLSSVAASLGTEISPLRWNIHPTAPASAMLPPFLCLIVAHFECPDMTHPRLFHVTAAWPGSSMEEFLRRRAVSEHAGQLAAALNDGCAAAELHANRGTVAKKNYPRAETYGEPQTPADPR